MTLAADSVAQHGFNLKLRLHHVKEPFIQYGHDGTPHDYDSYLIKEKVDVREKSLSSRSSKTLRVE